MIESEQTVAARRSFLAQLAWAATLGIGDRVRCDGRVLCVTGIRPQASLPAKPLTIWGYFEDDPQQAGIERYWQRYWQGVTPLPDGKQLSIPLPSPTNTKVAR